MNDVEFILKEDIKAKKQAGRGYRYKKNGSKSKKCRLPSDSLSKKEIEKMNGECKVYNINKPMTYKEFCAMPADIQIMYLENLRDKYGASLLDIANMMGCKYTTLTGHKRITLDEKPAFISYNSSRLDIESWNRFINGEKAEDSVSEGSDENLGDTCGIGNSFDTERLSYNEVVPKADIVNGSINLKGKADDIFRKMSDILGCENEYDIYVCFKSVSK